MAEFLGKPVSNLLESEPFTDWPFQSSVDNDSDPPVVGYTFEGCGLQFNCDRDDERVRSIFLEAEEHAGTILSEVPFDQDRKQVLAHFGFPSKSGEKVTDSILGDFGPWDQFQGPEYTIHVQYRIDSGCIEMITLMRNDIAP